MTITVVVIDPYSQTVQEHDLPSADFNAFCRTMIGPELDFNRFARGVNFVIDDWAVTRLDQCFFRIENYSNPLGGKVVFFCTNEAGETITAPLSLLRSLKDKVTWCPKT